MMLLLIASLILAIFQNSSSAQPVTAVNAGSRMNQYVDSLLALMTLEEKLGQLVQYAWPWNDEQREKVLQAFIKEGKVGSFLGVHGVERTRLLQRIAVEESRLKIPLLFAHDVIHGFRTIFPVPIAEASSWDPAAVEQSARIAAIEATAAGLHWTYAPMVDIARDPRWGRIVEGSGEDPYLGSVMAAARVRGFQGQDLSASNTLLACTKHFVAYGGAEGGRDYNTVDISERTLREIYLPPFHAAVKAGVATLMGGFNEIAGVPMHANHYLLTKVLREEWGFRGLVISDYTAVMELQKHGVAATPAQAGMLALEAGVDIDIDAEREKRLLLHPDHLKAARDLARKAIVLLKNERQVLPLAKNLKTLAVIGSLADDKNSSLGSWAAAGRPEDAVTILEGIRRAVSPQTKVLYAKGGGVSATTDRSGIQTAVNLAKEAEAVVLVLGETADMSAEAANRSALDLPGLQQELAQAVHATSKPVVAVLMNGRPLSINWLAENVPAILETWFLGVQMGPAVAEVLFGDYNPGGKLPVTFPRTVGQVPIYYNHKNTGRPPSEDRFTSKYLDLPSSPLYPFGYGLSYTKFSYSNLKLSAAKMKLEEAQRQFCRWDLR
jgi:beta-glucosidase